MNGNQTHRRGRGYTALLIVGALASIAVFAATFLMSAPAVTAVATAAGTSKTIAWAMVPSVDGLMITGTVVFISRQVRRGSIRYPLTVLLAGIALSIVCNALHSQHASGQTLKLGHWAPVVSAIPAVAMALSFHLIADMIRDWLSGSADTVSDASGAPPQTLSQTPPQTLPQTRLDTPADALPDAPADASAGAPQTLSQTLPQTLSDTAPDAARTTSAASAGTAPSAPRHARGRRARPAKKVAATGPIPTEEIRALLEQDVNTTAADVARALGRAQSGTLRAAVADIRSEVQDAMERPALRAVGGEKR